MCLRAGGEYIVNPDLLLERMSRAQYLEWEAFYQLDPWDGERDDLLAGRICSAIAASVGVELPAKEFMPDWLDTEERSSLPTKEEHEEKVDKVFAALRLMSKQHGSDNNRPGDRDKRPHEAA